MKDITIGNMFKDVRAGGIEMYFCEIFIAISWEYDGSLQG